ncbi:MAG: hypothetical protein DMF76_00010 [Acidobacteria bacterium]|nr:MAG: hypothetical protein DMF76_00010 [Acidobacteriota bacterium]
MYKHRSRTTTIWATLALAASFGLWRILPESLRNQVLPTAHAATFTVNTADDHNDGVCNAADCTLREAINAANAGDTISFNIPGAGVHTINATNGFSITKAVTIDGSTQPGYAGAPLIEINGAGVGAGVNGFAVSAPNVIIRGFIINRFPAYAISFDSLGNDSVQSCYLGTNATGTAASANGAGGIRINAPNITIGGITSGAGNLISGNKGNGIDVFVGNATIQGNFIGTNSAGTTKVSNASGVVISGAANNMIGGTTAAVRNIISGNTSVGVEILNVGATNNVVQGNFIGTDVTGSNAIGNVDGVQITAEYATIGGTSIGAGNVISGNYSAGVVVLGGSAISILGNLIGQNAAATDSIPNVVGIGISSGSAKIGGTEPGSRNIISGNGVSEIEKPRPEFFYGEGGVWISGGSGTEVIGNFIGPSADGMHGGGYQSTGVVIEGTAYNIIIGGTTPAARNVISGNFVGMFIGTRATNNVIEGNYIGTDLSGAQALSNTRYALGLFNDASRNVIGGTTPGSGNTIAFNGEEGVLVAANALPVSGFGNAILGNSIFSNGRLGVDLFPLGVTPNDECDRDSGSNTLQNSPVIVSATSDSTTTTIQGRLNSSPNTPIRIEFFVNSACDSSASGEGQTYLGFTNITTDASCNASFIFTAPNGAITGPVITATATDPAYNTSEFSACTTVVGLFRTIQLSAAAYTVAEGGHVDVTITRTTDTSDSASVSLATSNGGLNFGCDRGFGFASSVCDYETRLALVKFAPGETSKTVSILVGDDSYAEGPETFTVSLTNSAGATLGAPSVATVTIADNDLANGPNLIDVPAVFVRAHYLDFLNREPDQSGFDFWTNQITSCGVDQACFALRRMNVSAAFSLSIEFQQTGYFVERIYKTAFGDNSVFSDLGGPPFHLIQVPSVRLNEFLFDTQEIGDGVIVGQSGWETVLENNRRAYTLDFVQRTRFLSSYSTAIAPMQFVDQLFAKARVTPSDADRNAAIAEFGGATNTSDVAARARALRDVVENTILIQQEFNRAFVLMEYFGYLRRNLNDPPDNGSYSGYDFWLTKLNQFNGDFQKSEMVKAFISSTEYRQRFGP